MADSDENGASGQPAAAAGQAQPRLNVVAQYLKDLSFENPDAPNSLSMKNPRVNLAIDVQATPLTGTDVEVALKLELNASENEKTLFAVELVYAGVFRIENIPEPQRSQVVMIECPRILLPFARAIIAQATREGGFPALMLDPVVDFAALYRNRMGASAQGGDRPPRPN
jgi:preprotein translocase subunit SecB